MDLLMDELRSSGYGCMFAGHWLGGLALADDVILLSPSVQGLQNMVNICADYAKRSDLLFSTDPNPEKSKTLCIAFGYKDPTNLAKV